MREKLTNIDTDSEVSIDENKIVSFIKNNTKSTVFRVIENGYMGVHYQQGEMSDEDGFARAEKNLELKRPYKFDVETGKRHRNKKEKVFTDKELLEMAREGLKTICQKYPDFIFKGGFYQSISIRKYENEKGLDYSNEDAYLSASINFKHKDSKDIMDGYFGVSDRKFTLDMFFEMADNYLENYTKEVELPEEVIVQGQYYGYIGKIRESLDAEYMSLGTSLFAGKVGEKLFSEDFSLSHDVSDEICWNQPFFDGEGVVLENDRLPYIENGVLLRGYADKKTADKFGVEHTGSAYTGGADVPANGNVNLQIKRSEKTIKQLLDGRKSVILLMSSGGGFNEKGDYVMPVQRALLCDGEKILGRINKEFTISTNMYKMFGEDFIGVGSDQPVFHDKSVLFKVSLGN